MVKRKSPYPYCRPSHVPSCGSKWQAKYWRAQHEQSLKREAALKAQVEALEATVRDLNQRLYGRKSEKSVGPDQTGRSKPTSARPRAPRALTFAATAPGATRLLRRASALRAKQSQFLDDQLHDAVRRPAAVRIGIDVGQHDDRRVPGGVIGHKARKARQVAVVTDQAEEVGDVEPILGGRRGADGHPLEALGLRGGTQQRTGGQGPGPNVEVLQRRDGGPRTPGPGGARVGHIVAADGRGVTRRRHGADVGPEHVAARVRTGDRRGGGQARVVEFEGREDPVRECLCQRVSGERLDEPAEEHAVRVRVVEIRPGREVRRPREADRQQLLRRPDSLRVRVERRVERRVLAVVVEPARHVEELPDRDGVAVGDAGQVTRDRIVQPEPALVHKLEDHRAREGLGDAPDPHMLVDLHRFVLRDVPYAEGLGPAAAVGGVDRDDQAWDAQLAHRRRHERLEPFRAARRRRGRVHGLGAHAGAGEGEDQEQRRAQPEDGAREITTS
jgi:hypothetical protein